MRNYIKSEEYKQWGNTTLCKLTLYNGFEITGIYRNENFTKANTYLEEQAFKNAAIELEKYIQFYIHFILKGFPYKTE